MWDIVDPDITGHADRERMLWGKPEVHRARFSPITRMNGLEVITCAQMWIAEGSFENPFKYRRIADVTPEGDIVAELGQGH